MQYPEEIKRYEQWEREDPEDENSPEIFTGYIVFSTIKIGPRLEVRTTLESATGRAASSQARAWWVEYVIATAQGQVRGRITPRTLTKHAALQHAEKVRAQVEALDVTYPDQVVAYFRDWIAA